MHPVTFLFVTKLCLLFHSCKQNSINIGFLFHYKTPLWTLCFIVIHQKQCRTKKTPGILNVVTPPHYLYIWAYMYEYMWAYICGFFINPGSCCLPQNNLLQTMINHTKGLLKQMLNSRRYCL